MTIPPPSSILPLSRRNFLQVTAAGGAGAGSLPRLANAAGDDTIGIVHVGPRDDFGWNQAHAVAARALKTVAGVKVVEEENVPETDACAKSMESMSNLDGANLVFGSFFGHFDPFMIDLAKKYAKVEFRHAAARWDAAKHPKNLGIHVGLLKDNKGKVVIDKTYDNLDPLLGQMDYLLEGVVGSTT